MYHHLRGRLIEKNHTYAVVECAGIGFLVHISLHTYGKIGATEECFLYTHYVVREDAQQLFGFAEAAELDIFRHLIAVSGVGPNTARVILSTLSPEEAELAILGGDITTLKSVKGIGARTAERIIVDLKDKITKTGVDKGALVLEVTQQSKTREDALAALEALGFQKQAAGKLIQRLMAANPQWSVEQIIKTALKNL